MTITTTKKPENLHIESIAETQSLEDKDQISPQATKSESPDESQETPNARIAEILLRLLALADQQKLLNPSNDLRKCLLHGRFVSADLLMIKIDTRELVVNLNLRISLKLRAIAVLIVLALHNAETAAFLPANKIAERIELTWPNRTYWDQINDEDVRRAVSEIRKALDANQANQHIVESGPHGKGYRLSVPPDNVTIKGDWKSLL